MDMSPKDFVSVIQSLGMKSTKIHSSAVSCGEPVSVVGSVESYETSKFFSIDFTDSELAEYARLKKRKYKGEQFEPKPPTTLAAIFESFQMGTAGICDILVPSRLGQVPISQLGVANSVPDSKSNLAPAKTSK